MNLYMFEGGSRAGDWVALLVCAESVESAEAELRSCYDAEPPPFDTEMYENPWRGEVVTQIRVKPGIVWSSDGGL